MDPYWNDIINILNKDLATHEAKLIATNLKIDAEAIVIAKMQLRLSALKEETKIILAHDINNGG